MRCNLEGIRVALEVALQSFTIWANQHSNGSPYATTSASAPHLTSRTPSRKTQDPCGFYLWLSLDRVKELCGVWKSALLGLANDIHAIVVDEEYGRILQGIGTLLCMSGE